MEQFADVPVAYWAGAAGAALLIFLFLVRWLALRWSAMCQVQSVAARVVTKRAATYGHVSSSSPSRVYTSYFATFEMNSGDRVEFHLHDSAYGLLVEGDEGTLSYQGTRWHGFERKTRGKSTGRRAARARKS